MYLKKNEPSPTGFSLIEILIVIILLGILASLVSGNFLSSLKKGRDARRKTDLQEIQKALEMYYENNKAYPTPTGTYGLPFGGRLQDSNRVYMQRLPSDPSSNCSYSYVVDTNNYNYYYLLSTIENPHDNSYGVSQNGYLDPNSGSTLQCGTNCTCKFYVSSPNAPPLTPVP